MEAYQKLEKELQKQPWTGGKHVVACSSGTAALHLAFEALQLPLGSEVILSDFNMIACPRAVVMAGLKPVFVDCKPDLTINPEQVEEAIYSNEDGVTAILATHIYGRRCDMEALHDIARKYDLVVVEDLAEAHGIVPHKNTDAACHSYFRNKIICGEEGGSVAFNSSSQAEMATLLRCLGFTPAHDFYHIARGMNYRLANSLASRILHSLYYFEPNLFERRRIEALYDAACPPNWRMPRRDVVWVYDVKLSECNPSLQDQVVCALKERGIEARHGFKPCTAQSEFKGMHRGSLPLTAAKASMQIIYLPVVPYETDEEEVDEAFSVIRAICGAKVS